MYKILGLFLGITVLLAAASCKKNKEGKIVVYPNPATSYVMFDVSESNTFKNGEVTVKKMDGTVVATIPTTDSTQIRWNTESLERGVYNYWYSADKMKTRTGKIQLN